MQWYQSTNHGLKLCNDIKQLTQLVYLGVVDLLNLCCKGDPKGAEKRLEQWQNIGDQISFSIGNGGIVKIQSLLTGPVYTDSNNNQLISRVQINEII